jgi:hypothetical protein
MSIHYKKINYKKIIRVITIWGRGFWGLSLLSPLIDLKSMGQIRVFRTQGYKEPIIDYNPPIPPTNEQIVLCFGNTIVANLCFDPFEWMWKKVRKLNPLNIFEYKTK